jgi:hypothetical protein
MQNDVYNALVNDTEAIIQKMIKNFNDFVSQMELNLPNKHQIKTGNMMTYANRLTNLLEKLNKDNKKLYMKYITLINHARIEEMENVD